MIISEYTNTTQHQATNRHDTVVVEKQVFTTETRTGPFQYKQSVTNRIKSILKLIYTYVVFLSPVLKFSFPPIKIIKWRDGKKIPDTIKKMNYTNTIPSC